MLTPEFMDAILQSLREQGSKNVDVVHVRDDVWSIVGQVDVRALARSIQILTARKR